MNIVVVSLTRKIHFVGIVNQIDKEYIGNFNYARYITATTKRV